MKNGIRRLAALAFALVLVSAACGGDDGSDTTVAPDTTGATTTAGPTTTIAAGALDEYLVTPGTLTLVTTGNFPPFTRINEESGDVEGYSLDVGAEVASRLGLDFATPTVDFVAELECLQSGLYDIADSGIWPTQERQAAGFAFSRPMTSAGFIALVRTGSAGELAAGLEMDMAGLKVGAIQGSIHEQWTIENEATLGYDEYVPFAGAAEAFTGLKQGRVDMVTSDSVLASFNANEDPELEVVGATINAHPLSMTFRQDSQPLIDAINPVLEAMLSDGTLAEIQLKWFGRCLAVPDDINQEPPYDKLPTGC